MEENQDLQDILLDKEEEQGASKLRKVITTIVSLVILFLVVVIVVKFINSDADKESDLVSNETLILPEENLDNKVQIENTQNNGFTMPSNFDKQENVTNAPIFAPVASDDTFNKPSSEPKAEILKPEPSKPVEVNIEPEQIFIAPTPKPSATNVEKPSVAKIEKPSVAKVEKPLPTPQAPKPNISGDKIAKGTYVQVASLSTLTPSNAFFKKIKDAGYSYTTYKTIVNGKQTIKVLIGPFSQGELNENIGKIKADISNSAFIYRVR